MNWRSVIGFLRRRNLGSGIGSMPGKLLDIAFIVLFRRLKRSYQLSVISYRLSVISYQLSGGYHPGALGPCVLASFCVSLAAICRQLSVIGYQLSVGRRSGPSAVRFLGRIQIFRALENPQSRSLFHLNDVHTAFSELREKALNRQPRLLKDALKRAWLERFMLGDHHGAGASTQDQVGSGLPDGREAVSLQGAGRLCPGDIAREFHPRASTGSSAKCRRTRRGRAPGSK